MQLCLGKFFLKQRNNSYILDNKCINRVELKVIKILSQRVNFIIMERNIEGTVQTASRVFFLKGNNLLVFIIIKIVGLYAQGKFLKTDISGIGTVGISVG